MNNITAGLCLTRDEMKIKGFPRLPLAISFIRKILGDVGLGMKPLWHKV